ncbi:carotenoid 1,2-hydratase [Acidovorax sp. DW039]|nr:carotenoid 1,2-hydratase [Acidovorax sp. DW039]
MPTDVTAPAMVRALSRRRWLAWALGAMGAGASPIAQALPARALQFPRDHGSHPELRTEWWYITGYATAGGRPFGFQVTFFRSRMDATQGMQSAFAAKQLVFAHAALTDVQGRSLLHDQRVARAGFGVSAAEADTDVKLQRWTLKRENLVQGQSAFEASRYTTHIESESFGLQLQFDTSQSLLLQGSNGLSRKGPLAEQASYYYSQPQLAVSGEIVLAGRRMAVDTSAPARAWMDHEWSEALLADDAVGWDWIGMNLHDGSALTAFRLRRADGSALWAGGSYRASGQAARIFAATEVTWQPLRWWQSGRSNARYPVQWQVTTPAGVFTVMAMLDDQELDSSGSTGAVYWEGLSDLHNAQGHAVGKGYLEMTGYTRAMRL